MTPQGLKTWKSRPYRATWLLLHLLMVWRNCEWPNQEGMAPLLMTGTYCSHCLPDLAASSLGEEENLWGRPPKGVTSSPNMEDATQTCGGQGGRINVVWRKPYWSAYLRKKCCVVIGLLPLEEAMPELGPTPRRAHSGFVNP